MYKICKRESAAKRQAEIADSVKHLLLVSYYEQTTVADICRNASISRRTFYRFFDGKDDVIDYLIERAMGRDNSHFSIANSAEEAAILEFRSYFRFWLKNKDILLMCKRNNLDYYLQKHTAKMAVDLRKGIKEASVKGDPFLYEMTALITTSGIISILLAWRDSNFERTPEEMARTVVQLLFNPLYRFEHI